MVDIYRESKRTNNKQMLVNSGITLLQAKKIALCEYLEINPCNEYTKQ